METSTALDSRSGHATGGHATSHSRRRLGRAAAYGAGRGFASGVAATLAMSAVMLAAQKAGFMGQLPPQKITDRLLAFVGMRRRTPRRVRRAIAAATHFGFGGACGAAFGLAHEVWRSRGEGARGRRAPVLAGVAFASAVWASSYYGWVPAAGIMPKPPHDRRGRPTSMILAHWVFGGVLAKLVA